MRHASSKMLAALVLLTSWRRSLAEVYSFEKLKVPEPMSLRSLYFFFVYNGDDAPQLGANDEATVRFPNLSVRGGSWEDAGIQLSLLRYEDFDDIPKGFCCTRSDVDSGKCQKEGDVHLHDRDKDATDAKDVYKHSLFPENELKGAKQWDERVIKTSSVYVLLVSNCGRLDFSDVTLSGDVIVRNPYGFLPGVDYPKLPFYGALAALYVFLSLVWGCLYFRFRETLFNIHRCIGAVLFFGCCEASLWTVHYNSWNSTGVRVWPVFVAAIWLSVLKCIFSYMLVFVGASGWGVTKPHLTRSEICKICIICFLFIGLDYTRRVVMAFRHSGQVPAMFLFLVLVPCAILNGGIYYSVFTALGESMEKLRAQKQTDKLALFVSLWRVLMVTLAVAGGTTVYEIFNVSTPVEERWRTEWILSDAVSHCLFLFVLLAMMVLWRPHSDSQRYAYSTQLDAFDADANQSSAPTCAAGRLPSVEESKDDDADDHYSTEESASGVHPEKLGSTTANQVEDNSV